MSKKSEIGKYIRLHEQAEEFDLGDEPTQGEVRMTLRLICGNCRSVRHKTVKELKYKKVTWKCTKCGAGNTSLIG